MANQVKFELRLDGSLLPGLSSIVYERPDGESQIYRFMVHINSRAQSYADLYTSGSRHVHAGLIGSCKVGDRVSVRGMLVLVEGEELELDTETEAISDVGVSRVEM